MNKFFYIYTDDDSIIQNIEDSQINSEFNEYKISLKQKKNFDNIEINQIEKYMLLEENGIYMPLKVSLIYYSNEKTIITPRKEKQYDDDPTLEYGYAEFEGLVSDFISGKRGVNIRNYRIEKAGDLLTFTKIDESEYLREPELISKYKILFRETGEIKLQYNKTKNQLKIDAITDIKLNDSWIYFTRKYDSSILLSSINFEIGKKNQIFDNIEIDDEFDAYSPIAKTVQMAYTQK